MKNTMKTNTQKALEFKRQELKDIKAAAKRAQADLRADVAKLLYEMKTLRKNVMTDKSADRLARKEKIADRRTVIKLQREEKAAARAQKRGSRVLAMSARMNAISEKRAVRAAAKAARIDALLAQVEALKNPVGVAAKKAAKKPSKVTIVNPLAALDAAMKKAA
jgi:hypothetical protein